MNSKRPILILILGLVISMQSLMIDAEASDAVANSAALREAVTRGALEQHLNTLQTIAEQSGGHRSAGSAGYDASVDYFRALLESAGYDITVQPFEVDVFDVLSPAVLEQLSPDVQAFVEGTDVTTMAFSGSGEVTAAVEPIDLRLPPGAVNSSTSGCEAADFASFTTGHIALLQRGTCTFLVKAQNAVAAGASAVIIFNEGQAGRRELFPGSLGRSELTIPVLSTSFDTGLALAQAGGTAHLKTDTLSERASTSNLIAESRTGDPSQILMSGAHLDSVREGPGIQDNGSGSVTLLEVALQLAEHFAVNDPASSSMTGRVRFAWWGAEEQGLLGSRHYVDSLSPEELERIDAYLNLDMIGSPNFGRFVYDGDSSEQTSGIPLPEGSGTIELIFEAYFETQELPISPISIGQRSDHAAFVRAGIPVGGLFTGAEDLKGARGAARFGGEAERAFDPCYHRACDTIENVDFNVLEQMADAAAHAIMTLAGGTDLR
ncbi:MAG: M28 family peptidase [Trueperaceae bacterium]|nr:MAG: M28 family peptidase [Trueperaceae bacterium]